MKLWNSILENLGFELIGKNELAAKFKAQNGSIICRELLSGEFSDRAPVSSSEISSSTPPSKRTAEYYKKRPCGEFVGDAAEILEAYLKI